MVRGNASLLSKERSMSNYNTNYQTPLTPVQQGLALEVASIDLAEEVRITLKLILHTDTPSPDSYRLHSEFEATGEGSMRATKAFSFGISREAYDKVYMPSRKISID